MQTFDSTSADERDELEPVARHEDGTAMLGTWDDRSVAFHCDAAIAKAEIDDQGCDGRTL
jgi:hypothetical protein